MDLNNSNNNLRWYVIFGLIGFILFFYYYPQIDDFSNINLAIDKEIVADRVLELADDFNVDLTGYESDISFRRNPKLINYCQKKYGLTQTAKWTSENFPAYFWRVEYTTQRSEQDSSGSVNVTIGRTEERERPFGRRGRRSIVFEIASNGQLITYENLISPNFPSDSLELRRENEIEIDEVKNILHKYTSPDFTGWRQSKQEKLRRPRARLQHFVWVTQQVEWADSLNAVLDFQGKELRRFNLSTTVPDVRSSGLGSEEIYALFMIIPIILLSIFVLVSLVKRLRQDKIDFKNSWVIGISTAISMALIILPSEFDESIYGILIGIVVASPFVGMFAFLLSSVSESVVRDVWNEKLFSYDRLFNGRIKSLKVGHSFLGGFFAAGIFLGLLFLFLLVVEAITPIWIEFNNDKVSHFVARFPFFMSLGSSWLKSVFILFAIPLFAFSHFRRLIKKNLIFILLASITFAIMPLKIVDVEPFFVPILLNFLLGFILVWMVLRFDFVAIFVTFFTILLVVSAIPFLAQGSTFYLVNGSIILFFPFVFLIIGIVATKGKESQEDEREYVPAYLKRWREKERLQRELEIARTVQLKFLPQSNPTIKWLDVASNCIPAYEVGGDYYDFLQLDEHRFGVVVGDVSGKGVSAAFYMTLMKGIVKSQTRNVQSPKEVLIQINDLFYENAQRGVFISMIYGVFDQQKQTFSFARAGHNPLITLFRQKDKAEEISPKGIAIGLDKGLVFNKALEESTISITPGDVFVFYTDGYTEAMDEKRNEFGEERLIEIINKNSDLNVSLILTKIQDEVVQFTGKTPQHDDMTMVVVKVCGT